MLDEIKKLDISKCDFIFIMYSHFLAALIPGIIKSALEQNNVPAFNDVYFEIDNEKADGETPLVFFRMVSGNLLSCIDTLLITIFLGDVLLSILPRARWHYMKNEGSQLVLLYAK